MQFFPTRSRRLQVMTVRGMRAARGTGTARGTGRLEDTGM